MKPLLLFVWLTMCVSSLQAQWLKKMTDKIKGQPAQSAPAQAKEDEEDAVPADGEGDPLSIRKPARQDPSLIIGGDEKVRIDSTFEFDVAVYQETAAFQGNQLVKDGGEDIVIYYSSKAPQFSIQMTSKSTSARYHYFADFQKESQLSITAINGIASGDKEVLDLNSMEPVFPGESGYLNQLLRTGAKKVIAGVACEEYVAQNAKDDPRVLNTHHALMTAHVWIPMEPHTLFHGYGLIPDKYKILIEKMRIEGSYAPVVLPLEMELDYGNGERVITSTTEIIMGEPRKVRIADINK
ncbi:hypothetical protein [uncultured Chitinophaga sp.]|jgi:hypothetical protein|uniref:hypothetical protein n=1 Tax=uncultured Chitinophaga sp. TaxID=339340 RepID=UPI002627B85D|nr:hypothetical protein [uncultured Chitinophaga sp.]